MAFILDQRLCHHALKAGYLLKQGHLRKNWKRRWFVLQDDLLFYFVMKEDDVPLGYVLLEGCMVFKELVPSREFMFHLHPVQSKKFCLVAQDEEEMESWMRALTISSNLTKKPIHHSLSSSTSSPSNSAPASTTSSPPSSPPTSSLLNSSLPSSTSSPSSLSSYSYHKASKKSPLPSSRGHDTSNSSSTPLLQEISSSSSSSPPYSPSTASDSLGERIAALLDRVDSSPPYSPTHSLSPVFPSSRSSSSESMIAREETEASSYPPSPSSKTTSARASSSPMNSTTSPSGTPFVSYSLLSLPTELIFYILQFLPAEDLCVLSMVCKMFTVLASDDRLWEPMGYAGWEHQVLRRGGWKNTYIQWIRQQYVKYKEAFVIRKQTSSSSSSPNGSSGSSSPFYSSSSLRAHRKQVMDYDITVSLVLVGNMGVGKSSLISRFADDTFKHDFFHTIGFHFRSMSITLNDQRVKLLVWDTAGTIPPVSPSATLYHLLSSAVFVVFDLTNYGSFESVSSCIEEIQKAQKTSWNSSSSSSSSNSSASPSSSSKKVAILVGTKSDLVQKRVVSAQEIEEVTRRHSIPYVETSSCLGHNVSEAFVLVCQTLLDKMTREVEDEVFGRPRYIPKTLEQWRGFINDHYSPRKKSTKCSLQ